MKRSMLLVLVLLATLLVSCGGAGTAPATTILGKWQSELGKYGYEFFDNGIVLETKLSGAQFGGNYTLSDDGKTLMLSNDLGQVSYALSFPDGDTLVTDERARFHRIAPAVAADERPAAQRIVGSWAFNQYAGASADEFTGYDFFPDGTYATYLVGQPSGRGRYEISADGASILMSMEGGESGTRPIKLLNKQTLVFELVNVYLRSADTPARPLPGPIGQEQPGGAAVPAGDGSAPAADGATAVPPPTIGPPPAVKDVAPGQVATVAPYAITVHGAQILEYEPAGFNRTTGKYLVVDFSARNDSAAATGGVIGWSYAILSATGERLNEEGTVGLGFAKALQDQLPDPSCADQRFFPVPTVDLQPGLPFRSSVGFKLTPGLEAEKLQFEVTINQSSPGISFGERKQLGTATFLLSSTRDDTPLPLAQPPAASYSADGLEWSSATLGAAKMVQEQQPCTSVREAVLTVSNTNPKTAGLPLGQSSVYLIAADGHWFAPDSSIFSHVMDGSYALEPKQSKQVAIPFTNTFGVKGAPAALVISSAGSGWHTLAISQ